MLSRQASLAGERPTPSGYNFNDDSASSAASEARGRIDEKKSIRSKFHETYTLSTLALLTALKITITAELPKITFDYSAFHRTWWSLLRRVQRELDPKIVEYYTREYIERENQLPFMVDSIFMTALGSSKAAEAMGLMKATRRVDELKVTSLMLHRAGSLVEDFLENQERDKKVYGEGYVYAGTRVDETG